ncbi:pentapeptide repeat-containing protein [Frankia sp. Cas8]|uniref:pentapeptide repeat-containing protein n=1 Tax=unclassified Frankia TaxID=2632575 RepID=UPI003A0FFB6C
MARSPGGGSPYTRCTAFRSSASSGSTSIRPSPRIITKVADQRPIPGSESRNRSTSLTEADLHHANLSNAILAHTRLPGANVSEAHMQGSNLRGTDLRGANLTEVAGLSQDQLNQAFGDRETRLPSWWKWNVTRPVLCRAALGVHASTALRRRSEVMTIVSIRSTAKGRTTRSRGLSGRLRS